MNGCVTMDFVAVEGRGCSPTCFLQRLSLSSGSMRAQSSPIPEEEPPSSALASVVQHLPLELMDGVVRNLSNDDSVTDSQMLTAISRWVLRVSGWGQALPSSLLCEALVSGRGYRQLVRSQALIPAYCEFYGPTLLVTQNPVPVILAD